MLDADTLFIFDYASLAFVLPPLITDELRIDIVTSCLFTPLLTHEFVFIYLPMPLPLLSLDAAHFAADGASLIFAFFR